MSNHPVPAATALDRTALVLVIEELRAELSNCLDRKERRQIEAELRAAHAQLAAVGAA